MASHHHHSGEGEDDDDEQCHHDQGVAHIKSHILNDPLMKKQDWDLNDYEEIYNKTPSSKSKGKPSKQLLQYVKQLLPKEPARILVPLCGKSPDLRWLYERGNTVVGLEGVEKPVREFFQLYPDLSHSVLDLTYGKLYKSADERLQVFVCDVAKIPSGALGKFDAGFDWGAYTAICPSLRQRYVEVVTEALREDSRYFLEVCHDGPPDATGIPHSVPFRNIKLDLGVGRKMEVLATLDISLAWGVDSLFNSHILFTPAD